MKFSFIIPTRNEGKYLEGCLLSIKNQSKKDYEIIVVDTNSRDETKKIARKYSAKIINEPKKGPAAARNSGAKIARGQILVFCDADVRFDMYFLEEIDDKFKRNISGCIFRVHTYDAVKKSTAIAYQYMNMIAKIVNKFGFVFTNGSCFAYRRDVFFRVNGFNEDMLTNEDHDLANRANKIQRFVFFDDIVVETSARRVNKLGLFRSIRIYVKSTILYVFNGSYLRDYW
mgnify:CR=1 FL=1